MGTLFLGLCCTKGKWLNYHPNYSPSGLKKGVLSTLHIVCIFIKPWSTSMKLPSHFERPYFYYC